MNIRRLQLGDVPALIRMARDEKCFKASKTVPGFWSKRQLRRWIIAGEDVLLVAEVDGKVVGFVLTTHHKPTGKVTWENHFVLASHQGQRIGEALADEMRKYLKAMGATYLHFLVRADNEDGICYYMYRAGSSKGAEFVWFDEKL